MTSRIQSTLTAHLLIAFIACASLSADENQDRWWPTQRLPKGLIQVRNDSASSRLALDMMTQSLAGLAAKALNESRGDEMVWVDNSNFDLDDWKNRMLAKYPQIEKRGSFAPWDLVDRYANLGIIKGYILYRSDKSSGPLNSYRAGLDCSVNVATSLSGLLDGIIVAEELQETARAHGLKLLLDARDKSQQWCFQTYKDQFNRRILCTQDPQKPHIRDLAIAQKALTIYGKDQPTPSAIEWLEPLSPILGWNGGDEFQTTDLSTRYGHIQTATDWSMNLPLLMAGSETYPLPKIKNFDPGQINWSDKRSAVSFIGTDGDNVQWLESNFFRHQSYWADPARGKIPYGWSSSFAHFAQLCPEAIEYALSTRTPNDSFIEWGGGYYYPDHFGSDRANRWELLAQQARRTWTFMKQTGTRIIGFNVTRYNSPETRKACQIFAGQTDGLLGILIFQYSPYEAGAGETFWVKDRNRVDLPVITARYSIWEHQNARERSGTPAKVAREIRQTVEHANTPRYDWVIAHAWSYFKRAPGADENAENLEQENAPAHGGVRGYTPVTWCAERLPANIRVVSPEELIWRIRMNHHPAQTQNFMGSSLFSME
jgi:hypothetical protein